MSIKQATKPVKLADCYFKFGEMFPPMPSAHMTSQTSLLCLIAY